MQSQVSGVVFAAFPWAALIVKVLGAAYLMWFGFGLLLKAGKSALAPCNNAVVGNFRQSFIQGVVTNIGNLSWPIDQQKPQRLHTGRRCGFQQYCSDHLRSNRSRFITLSQAATKSFTNFSFASSLA
nr:LysE family transporter [Pseudomonas sp. PICF141]